MKTLTFLFVVLIFIYAVHGEAETTVKQTIKVLKPVAAKVPPQIDGLLDDEAWKAGPLVDDIFITYNPLDGDVLPQKTQVWMAYDPDNLYFAFYCFDTEAAKIKTSVTRRDNLWNDDWVGLGLDANGNRQSLYELFVNPSGMQGDLFNTPASGENGAPDWVWYSSGQVVDDGYIVEIKLPLKSIRFKSGKDVGLNVLFWRRISRLGMSGAWPAIDPGQGIINSTTKVVYGKLDHQLKLEFLPSLTYNSIWDRQSPAAWSDPDDTAEIGLSAKYGITSSITLEATVNPDFSQVESDEFQVVANRRYPIFYSEKRPFFMEAGDLFDLAGPGENMLTTVHTRKIVDPAWGARLTGEIGKTSFGFLAAGDEWAGREFEAGEINPYRGKNADFRIGRGKLSLGDGNYIGALYSGRELGNQYNRAIGTDLTFRFWGNHALEASYIYSFSNDPAGVGKYEGGALSAEYNYSTRSFYGELVVEHFARDFRMDTAFYNRTGIASVEAYLSPRFFPNKEKLPWFHRFSPYIYASHLHDTVTKMDDNDLMIGVDSQFTKQGYLSLYYKIIDEESWAGQTFRKGGIGGSTGIQLSKWLNLHTCFDLDKQIYYDKENPFSGDRFRLHAAITLQPNDKFSQYFSYGYTGFDRHSNGEDIYDYHIFLSRTTYQFNKYLFIRALIQYDSYQEMVLSDLLASFTLIPGTVVHLGYGSLHENRQWNPLRQEWEANIGPGKYYQTTQSFFLKVSYLISF
jgi:hypothetical protein